MNKNIKSAFLAVVTISSLFLIDLSHAKSADKAVASSPAAGKTMAAAKHKMIEDKLLKLEDDAVAVVSETPKAIIALEKKDTESAKKILNNVSAKLSNLLAKNPGLSLIPADIDVDVIDYEGSSQTTENAISTAKDLMVKGKLQEA